MSERIDHELIRQIILTAIGPWACIHEAREHDVFLIPARDRAVELAMPLGPRIAQQYANRMPRETRVEILDLEQAGRQGVLEGIDRYKPRKIYQSPSDKKAGRPGKPIQVDTYLYLWIKKRVLEEIAGTHWRVSKPPRKDMERYMKGEMTELENLEYVNSVTMPAEGDFHGRWNGVERTGYQI